MTDIPASKYDYWVLRFFRDTAAITTFIVAPVFQIFETRSLPVFLLASLLFLILGHALTGLRYVPSVTAIISDFARSGSRPLKWFVISYTALIAWMWFTLLWSPAPKTGALDPLIVALIPIFAVIFSLEFSKTIILPFGKILLIGYFFAALMLVLELSVCPRMFG